MSDKPADLKPDHRITSAVQIALDKARRYGTTLAVAKGEQLMEWTPDEFERNMPGNARE